MGAKITIETNYIYIDKYKIKLKLLRRVTDKIDLVLSFLMKIIAANLIIKKMALAE